MKLLKHIKTSKYSYFTDNDVFDPIKIVTDRANLVYIVLAGNFMDLLTMIIMQNLQDSWW